MLQTLVNASVSQFSLVCSSITSEGINLTLADGQKCSIALLLNQNVPSPLQKCVPLLPVRVPALLATLYSSLLVKDSDFSLMYINIWLSTLENSAGHSGPNRTPSVLY